MKTTMTLTRIAAACLTTLSLAAAHEPASPILKAMPKSLAKASGSIGYRSGVTLHTLDLRDKGFTFQGEMQSKDLDNGFTVRFVAGQQDLAVVQSASGSLTVVGTSGGQLLAIASVSVAFDRDRTTVIVCPAGREPSANTIVILPPVAHDAPAISAVALTVAGNLGAAKKEL